MYMISAEPAVELQSFLCSESQQVFSEVLNAGDLSLNCVNFGHIVSPEHHVVSLLDCPFNLRNG